MPRVAPAQMGLRSDKRATDRRSARASYTGARLCDRNLALFYTQMGRYLEAEAAYREQLAIYTKLMEHETTTYAPLQALALSVFGDLYWEMGLPDKSLEHYRAAMDWLGTRRPSTVSHSGRMAFAVLVKNIYRLTAPGHYL